MKGPTNREQNTEKHELRMVMNEMTRGDKWDDRPLPVEQITMCSCTGGNCTYIFFGLANCVHASRPLPVEQTVRALLFLLPEGAAHIFLQPWILWLLHISFCFVCKLWLHIWWLFFTVEIVNFSWLLKVSMLSWIHNTLVVYIVDSDLKG